MACFFSKDWDVEMLLGLQRVFSEFVAQLNESHLSIQPKRVFSDGVHRLDDVVTNQVQARPKHHERFETCPHAMARKLEVANVVLLGEQGCAQLSGIGQKILLKTLFSRAGVGKQTTLVFGQRDNSPLV